LYEDLLEADQHYPEYLKLLTQTLNPSQTSQKPSPQALECQANGVKSVEDSH